MDVEAKKQLLADLLHIAEETREFDPPYIPSYYLQDVANSDPAELVYKYVLAKDMTDGYERLWGEGRLDLAVENVCLALQEGISVRSWPLREISARGVWIRRSEAEDEVALPLPLFISEMHWERGDEREACRPRPHIREPSGVNRTPVEADAVKPKANTREWFATPCAVCGT